MKSLLTIALTILISSSLMSQDYEVGDYATDFKLLNIDGKYLSLSDYKDAKGFIVIFTTNHCPYAVAWEDRIIDLDKTFKSKGYPVIAINPNSAEAYPEDSYEKMIERAEQKGFTFPYLHDTRQEIYKIYGATKTPHVYVLKKESDKLKVAYIGAIDNNYRDASEADEHYVRDAVNNLLAGKKPDPDFTRAIGCSIK
ncbi:MAG: thioredoxin family protein [Bacteroidales bacterium]|jgi:peroxiredoxin|nr:thioredoxin family protein [Bacteroidales bacterium]